MKNQLSKIETALPQCMIADRPWVENKLRNIRSRLKRKQPVDRIVSQVEHRVESSIKRSAFLAEQLNRVKYPDLPVAQKRDQIIKLIAEHQVVVVAGETGSGKTTQLPKMCIELGLGKYGLIGHTQPRRLAARTVAARIAEELETPLGSGVGYQVRFSDQVSDQTRIKLMTDGILLAAIQQDPLLLGYEVLIIDEAHERSLNIDFLLGYIKRILPQRPDLKVIITSATIDVQRFANHFNDAPVVEVSGRTYPVELLYRPPLGEGENEGQQQAILEAIEELEQIERSNKKLSAQGDILIFHSGEKEIRDTATFLRKAQSRSRVLQYCEVLPLYARLSLAEQNRVFHTDKRKGRRIVLATNVAETSLTVPGIRYVIDTGVARISRYSYRSKVQRLPIEAISQASANQRSGRCGRVAEGVCIRLYSEDDFLQRPEFTDAEIQRTNLASVILQMLTLKLGDISQFPFVDPPDNRYITDGFKLLQELGAVDQQRKITRTGWQLARLPIDPRLARMVVEAAKRRCLTEVLIIASALSVQDPRERPQDKQQASDEKHRAYAHEESDFLTWVNLWNLYEEQRQELSQNQLRKFCSKNYLSYMRMREWRETHRQLHLICKELKNGKQTFVENEQPAGYEAVHRSLLSGLLSHIGIKHEKKEYIGARNRHFFLFPGSGLYKKAPKWIMAAEMVETTQLYARCLARIEPAWAESLAPDLIKKHYSEPHWEMKRGEVIATEQVLLYGLIIIPKRRVSYGRIDQEVSHELFIRYGLVEGELGSKKAAFIRKNRQLLQSVEQLEAKSRRKDLLVDEEQLFEFYRLRLKSLEGEQLVNRAGFEKWYKAIEADQPEALIMQEEDILQRSTDHVTAQQYPDHLQAEKTRLRISYNFEPGTKDDGVTLHIPLPLLLSLPLKKLQWLVPGMLEEKVVAILRGLPKQQRKHFVPVPNYASAFVQAAPFAEGDLYEMLALHLLRMTGVRIGAEILRAVELPEHLLFNLSLQNEKGKQITASRSWAWLNERYADKVDDNLSSEKEQQWGREGITSWDFGELKQSERITQYAGVEVEAYPALQDCGETVTLCLKTNRDETLHISQAGVIRLALLSMTEQIRYARKQITGQKLTQILLQSGGVLDQKQVERDLVYLACRNLLRLDEQLPRDSDQFKTVLEQCKQNLVTEVENLLAWLVDCFTCYHRIQKKLKGRIQLEDAPILNDVKQQLSELFSDRYMQNNSWLCLQHYPRYLQAVELRLEKFRRNLRQERLLTEQLTQLWQQYINRKEKHQKQGIYDPKLTEYRWLLEEYRVSLFAQQLGTQQTVSEKRVKHLWREVIE